MIWGVLSLLYSVIWGVLSNWSDSVLFPVLSELDGQLMKDQSILQVRSISYTPLIIFKYRYSACFGNSCSSLAILNST